MDKEKAMNKVLLSIPSAAMVKEFVQIASKYSCQMDIKSGRHLVDAKSILGIFSLDLSKPVELIIDSTNLEEIEEIKEQVKAYIV